MNISAHTGPARAVAAADYLDLGFDELYLHFVGQEQAPFIDAFADHVLPQLRCGSPRQDRECSVRIAETSRPLVEERRHLLPGRGDVLRLRRRRHRRFRRPDPARGLPRGAGRDLHLAHAVLPTPDRDDGYDVTDFYGVDRRLGTLGDLVEFIRTAKDRGMRVIADFVVNHTSDQHPWFQAARRSGHPYRDYYVWRNDPPPDTPERWCSRTRRTHLDPGQADRRVVPAPVLQAPAGPERGQPGGEGPHRQGHGVLAAAGADGFRVDAVPFFLETGGGPADGPLRDPHEYLRDLRRS